MRNIVSFLLPLSGMVTELRTFSTKAVSNKFCNVSSATLTVPQRLCFLNSLVKSLICRRFICNETTRLLCADKTYTNPALYNTSTSPGEKASDSNVGIWGGSDLITLIEWDYSCGWHRATLIWIVRILEYA